jgi:protein involved in polysaccharide export with SLBB domain
MKYKYIVIALLCNILFAQVSLSDINKITNKQLDDIKSELSNQGSMDTIKDLDNSNVNSAESEPVDIELSSTKSIPDVTFFGYSYFKRDVSFFDNIPTPSNYQLGPGDEIIISLWGETNSREDFTINKDGLIYYENIGFINISNKNLKEAEELLINELSRVHSTLKDSKNQTNLMLELGKLKSLNVYFSGEIENPGISLIHPFSDLFLAIVQAGGIKKEGSLRNIQLIRSGKIIDTIDFYSFFSNGENRFSNIKIIDGDIIHIPSVNLRVGIKGAINKSGFYEILPDETLEDLLKYASGLKPEASSIAMIDQIIPIEERLTDDQAFTSMNIKIKMADKIILNNGDSIQILKLGSSESKVEILGRVKNPGVYAAQNSSLKDILDLAGGFDDPIFRKTIREDKVVILRQDENQFYSEEMSVAYKNADQFKLEINDKIFVYEDINYSNNFTYRVEGEVFKPGTYPISRSKITVREALSLAGGLTELTSERNITVKQEFTELNDEGDEITTSESVNNISLDFEIGINSVIIASPFENVVRIEGNVYSPGLVTYTKGYRFPKYIELAGGYRPNSLKRQTYIKRANGNIEETTRFYIVGKKVYPGDTLVVPVNPDPNDFDITTFISDLSTTLANIAAILLIVDNQTN